MSKQIALIVDDSKTAQIRLRKMLAKYDIEVDTTYSAEEALNYLTQKIPAVVFMDHHMEGMDGLEALKIIKANPKTAMIPVIMYTSEKGEVYVGQARALGALDILSKEIIKAENLHRVLIRLNIRLNQQQNEPTSDESEQSSDQEPAMPVSITPTSQAKPKFQAQETELQQLKTQLENLINKQGANINQRLEHYARLLNKRLDDQTKHLESRGEDTTIPLDDENRVNKVYRIEQTQRESGFYKLLLLVLIIGMGFLGYELHQVGQDITSIDRNYAEILATNQTQSQLIDQLQKAKAASDNTNDNVDDQEKTRTPSADNTALRALDWTFNEHLKFDYNQPPLGETQVSQINNLIYMLDSIGFTGEVNLEIHFGNLCLQGDSNGEWRPANSDLPIAQCIMYKDIVPDFTAESLISRPYLSLIQTAAPLVEGRMLTEIFSRGFESPQHAYPETGSNTTAADWNQIALKNNRVTVFLKGRQLTE